MRMLCEKVSKAFLKPRETKFTALLLSACQLCQHRRLSDWSSMISPLINPHWLFQRTGFCSLCLEMTPRMTCWTTFQELEVRLTGRLFSGSSMFPFLKTGMMLAFLHTHISCSPWPFKDDGDWLSKTICQPPQHSWVHLIGAHGFVDVRLA